MEESSPDRCEYFWPEDVNPDDYSYPNHQSCCWRETWREYNRCIWHAETDEAKPAEELKQDLEDPEDWERNPDLRDAPLQPVRDFILLFEAQSIDALRLVLRGGELERVLKIEDAGGEL